MAIDELHLIADLSNPTVARSASAQLIDEMLREISYGDGAWNREPGLGLMRTSLTIILTMMLSPALAGTIPVCSGGDRAARKLTCIVDGDTGWERGVKWRALNVDTPEISQPDCDAEKRLGLQARDRLQQLMAGGYRIEWTGGRGRYGRELARVILSDGRDAGQVLITEGLSQPWPNEGNRWCRR